MSSRRGFTLMELMIATAIAGVGVAAAFAFARTQIRGFTTQDEVARMQSSAQLVLEGLARDVRNAGYGTSFYAGMQRSGGFSLATGIADAAGQSRGFPALRVANNIGTPADVMPGSDAIMLLRVTSDSVVLEAALTCNPAVAVPYAIDPATLENLRPCLDLPQGLVLVSDSSRPTGEPESMLLPINGAASRAANALVFMNAYGINPADGTRCTNGSNPPDGVGVGSFAVCVQPTTYWIDRTARLRMWQPQSSAASVPVALAGGTLPINPAVDPVMAEGIEDLQFAFYMSAQSDVGTVWINDMSGNVIGDEGQMSEARVARISALVRTTRASGDTNLRREGLLDGGTNLEDHPLPALAQQYCPDPTVCYDPLFTRKLLRFQAELRNMRIFDVLSTNTRTWDLVRSYRN